ncbi:hypothetical protein [Desertivibrio insolitus]|uniref:hypothetical protein n=1 Tax=Herbiconiux sp. SYSU D00978 TaxID=2812562 RepID=UPI001A97C597|nr:hypothetical protein [Herbiconiux sp. SYSU D00978]
MMLLPTESAPKSAFQHAGATDRVVFADGVALVPPARSRRPLIALAVLVLVLLAAGAAVLALPKPQAPGTPLGASAELSGGLARINGVIPLETDGWLPPTPVAELEGAVPDGMHRVRIILEVTATEASGVAFDADDYAISGIGADSIDVLWAGTESLALAQGDALTAMLVFQIPDKAVALTLEGPDDARLALGTGHHSER